MCRWEHLSLRILDAANSVNARYDSIGHLFGDMPSGWICRKYCFVEMNRRRECRAERGDAAGNGRGGVALISTTWILPEASNTSVANDQGKPNAIPNERAFMASHMGIPQCDSKEDGLGWDDKRAYHLRPVAS
jgi:hypothetical protein